MKYAIGSTVGERGQITIEKAVRDALGVRPRDVAVQRVEEGRLVVTFLRPAQPHRRSLAGVLGTPPHPPSEEDWDDAVGAEIVADAVVEPPPPRAGAARSRSRSRPAPAPRRPSEP